MYDQIFSPSGMMDPAIPVPAEPEGFFFNIGQVGPGDSHAVDSDLRDITKL